MPEYHLDYVAPDGTRVRNITERIFEDITEAQREAARILAEFLVTKPAERLGHIEVLDEAGAWVSEFHFPDAGG